MNLTNILQNAQALSVSEGNNYSVDQVMHIFLDNFRQCEKYTAQISTHQVELISREDLLTKNIYLFHIYILTI